MTLKVAQRKVGDKQLGLRILTHGDRVVGQF